MKKNFEIKQKFPKDISKPDKIKIEEKMKDLNEFFIEMIKSKEIKVKNNQNFF